MKLLYGSRIARDGKVTFDVSHKWGKWSQDEQAVMVMRKVFDRYPDAEGFEWFADAKGDICAGRAALGRASEEVFGLTAESAIP